MLREKYGQTSQNATHCGRIDRPAEVTEKGPECQHKKSKWTRGPRTPTQKRYAREDSSRMLPSTQRGGHVRERAAKPITSFTITQQRNHVLRRNLRKKNYGRCHGHGLRGEPSLGSATRSSRRGAGDKSVGPKHTLKNQSLPRVRPQRKAGKNQLHALRGGLPYC